MIPTVSSGYKYDIAKKSVCFSPSCLARIPASLPRLTGFLLIMCHALKLEKYLQTAPKKRRIVHLPAC